MRANPLSLFKPCRGKVLLAASHGLVPAFLLASAALANSQMMAVTSPRFSVSWHTVDGGGGQSLGARYALHGAIGQPDAGTLAGPRFAVTGGFWSGAISVQPPGSPTLSIHSDGDRVTVSWAPVTPGFVLQVSDKLASPDWSDVPGHPTSPVTAPLDGAARFYRLRKL